MHILLKQCRYYILLHLCINNGYPGLRLRKLAVCHQYSLTLGYELSSLSLVTVSTEHTVLHIHDIHACTHSCTYCVHKVSHSNHSSTETLHTSQLNLIIFTQRYNHTKNNLTKQEQIHLIYNPSIYTYILHMKRMNGFMLSHHIASHPTITITHIHIHTPSLVTTITSTYPQYNCRCNHTQMKLSIDIATPTNQPIIQRTNHCSTACFHKPINRAYYDILYYHSISPYRNP